MTDIGFSGVTHPFTAEYPLMDADELADLAADIAANGLRQPLVLDGQGRLIDGQNRLAACELAGVEPRFVVADLPDDAAVAAFVSSANDRRRSQSAGVRWMRVGIALKRQGLRQGGRWKRGAISASANSDDSANFRMAEVGLVLDVAERAEALGDDFATWADLPQQVITGQVALKAAFLQAQKFDAHAAMAELIAYQPLAEWIGHHDHFATEATGRYATPPAIGQPWRPEHRRDLDNIAKKYQQAATTIRALIKENQS